MLIKNEVAKFNTCSTSTISKVLVHMYVYTYIGSYICTCIMVETEIFTRFNALIRCICFDEQASQLLHGACMSDDIHTYV